MKVLTILICFLFFFSCVERIEFPVEDQEELIVVDGIFSAYEGEQIIKLSKSIQVNSQVNVPLANASVFVEDEQGNKMSFPETESGVYKSQERAEVGKNYRLYAELPDGRSITSNFQSVPDSFSIKEINTIDTLTTFINESGSNQRLRALEFFARAKNESVENDLYLRYKAETVYQVLETQCGPFHNPKACYFYNDERPFDINLFEIDNSAAPIEFETLVLRRKIDYRLTEIFAIDLSLLSYNKEEFDYWKRLKQLFDQQGNINDVNPARLIGNVVANDGSEILGQFAVVGKSRKIRIIGNADFATSRLPFCGFAGNRPFPLPEECCDCLFLEGATLLKPDYWP